MEKFSRKVCWQGIKPSMKMCHNKAIVNKTAQYNKQIEQMV